LEKPPWLMERRLQVFRAVLAQVSIGHAGRYRHPLPAHVRPFHQLGAALADDLAERLGLLDDERDAWVLRQQLSPGRSLAWDDPEIAILPLLPAHGHIRAAIRLEAREIHVDSELEEFLHLVRSHPADLASPAPVGARHHNSPEQKPG